MSTLDLFEKFAETDDQRRSAGRPPLPPGAGRFSRVGYRTTQANFERIQKSAMREGVPIAVWLDRAIDQATDDPVAISRIAIAEDSQVRSRVVAYRTSAERFDRLYKAADSANMPLGRWLDRAIAKGYNTSQACPL